MNCEFCEGKTKPKKIKMQHWMGDKLFIVENVACEVCAECGEKYFHAKTLDEINQFLSGEHAVKELLNVEVVSMPEIATVRKETQNNF